MTHKYSNISPTAWIVAYRRTYSDIPMCTEIYNLIERPLNVGADLLNVRTAPQYEARYKLIDRLLRASNIDQVLELAAGLSPRGMNSIGRHTTYVETDLEDVINEKISIAKKLIPDLDEHGLYFEQANALDENEMIQPLRHFDICKKIAIINEGLMRYLNFEEKKKLAKNIHNILEKYGGVWITPDISIKATQLNEDKLHKDHIRRISSLTGVDIASNRFDNVNQAKSFFENLGFTVESHSFLEVTNELSSVKKLSITDEELMGLNGDAVVFVMRTV